MAGRQIEGKGGRRHRLLTTHDLAGLIASQGSGSGGTNDYNNLINKPTLGTASSKDVSYFASAAQGTKADSALQSIVAGDNITVDNTDPANPIVSATGGGGAGTVTSVDLTVPSWMAVTGSPVTTAGTLVVSSNIFPLSIPRTWVFS